MTVRVADANRSHLAALEALENVCFSLPWTREQLESQLPDERHVFLVAEGDDGQLLGYVGMMFVLDEGYISNVAVTPSARQRGIGHLLISELEKRADGLALSFMTLEVRASNAPAIHLYSRHGFLPVGRRKNYYERPTEDAILMTKMMK